MKSQKQPATEVELVGTRSTSKAAKRGILQRLQERREVYFEDAAMHSTIFFSKPLQNLLSLAIGGRGDCT